MKTTIDIPEDVYRKVKAKSALEGRPVRDVAITLFRTWIERPDAPAASEEETPGVGAPSTPSWFGSLRKYAHNARGLYDMDSVRRSIARGRAGKERLS